MISAGRRIGLSSRIRVSRDGLDIACRCPRTRECVLGRQNWPKTRGWPVTGGERPAYILNLAPWRRRAGSRISTGFDFEANLGSEHSHGCLPRSGALFGLNCCGTRSLTNDTTEVPAGSLASSDTSDLNPSTGAVLTDTVVRL